MVWKILLGILLLLLLLLMCPVRLRIRLQNEGNISIRAHAFCVPLFRHPKPKKIFREKDYSPRAVARRKRQGQKALLREQKKQAKKKAKAVAKRDATTSAAQGGTQKKKSSLTEKISMIGSLLREIPGPLFRYARVDLHALEVRVATGDAATTAIAYGAVCPAVAYLMEGLHTFSNLHVHHPERIRVFPDFEGQKTAAMLDLRLRLLVWQRLAVGLKALLRLTATRMEKSNRKPQHFNSKNPPPPGQGNNK